MLLDPGQAADVEAVPGTGDGYVGQAGFFVVDPADGFQPRAVRRPVGGWGEVVGDLHLCPFPAFGLVRGGDGYLGLVFGRLMGHGGQDGVRAVGVEQVDQGLQMAAGGVVGGVVLQIAPRW